MIAEVISQTKRFRTKDSTLHDDKIYNEHYERDNPDYNIYNEILKDNILSTDTIFWGNNDSSLFIDRHYSTDTATIIEFVKQGGKNTFYKYLPTVAFNEFILHKWVSVNRIKSQIISYQNNGDIEATLDYIFGEFDELLLAKKFDICNAFFEFAPIYELEINSLIGLLTITLPWKDQISMRRSFYQEVSNLVYANYFSEEANQILIGLE